MENVVLLKYPENWELDRKKVIDLALKCVQERALEFKVEMGLIFVNSKEARKLNMKFRKMDYVPQVLGFPISKQIDEDGLVRLGDIVICIEKLRQELKLAENKGKDKYEILDSWIRHGIENLLT